MEKYLFWHRVSLISYLGLLFLIGFWYLYISPPEHTIFWILLVAYILILLIPAPGLFKKQPRVYMWSSYLMLIYFSHAVIESWANDAERVYALIELILSSMYFVAATMCVRYVKHLKDAV